MNRVILFSGHMIDRPGRPVPRFPPDLVDRVRVELGRALDSMELGCGDVGICGAACGGDLLFAGEALDRGLRLEVFLGGSEDHHLDHSVSFAGEDWVTRYRILTGSTRVAVRCLSSSSEEALYCEVNQAMLERAIRLAPTGVTLLVLQDRSSTPDGPGGTEDMRRRVLAAGGTVRTLDLAALRGDGPAGGLA